MEVLYLSGRNSQSEEAISLDFARDGVFRYWPPSLQTEFVRPLQRSVSPVVYSNPRSDDHSKRVSESRWSRDSNSGSSRNHWASLAPNRSDTHNDQCANVEKKKKGKMCCEFL
jgi:hypothetical protein